MVCRADVDPAAAVPLATLMADIAVVLAEREGVDPAEVRIGPVDFGNDEGHPPAAPGPPTHGALP